MGEKDSKKSNKKQKHKHPNDPAAATSGFSFKPSSDVKGLKFGGQFIVKSFTIRRARPPELLRLLSLPYPPAPTSPLPSTIAFLPTNFTILAHHAWHTLTLGLGTKKSKVLIMVFESEALIRSLAVDRSWPPEIPLGEVNRRLIRGLAGCDLARFKFRKGCLTFYVYAVRRSGSAAAGFERAADLRAVLEAVVALRDFLDHTAMLAAPNQRSLSYAYDSASAGPAPSPVAMAH